VSYDSWIEVIDAALAVRERLEELDTVPLWRYPQPTRPASLSELEAVEDQLGELDPGYGAFLRCANGWPGFYQDVDLFGTEQLLGGPERAQADETLAVLVEAGSLDRIGVRSESVVPIAGSFVQTDLFLLCVAPGRRRGHVLWLAGDLIDEYQSFFEYFTAMIAYQQRQVDIFEGRERPYSASRQSPTRG
jgi:hypothetical protein